MASIMKQASTLDQDAIFDMLFEQVEGGKYDSYMDALAAYVEKNDLSEEEIREIVGPTLRQLILKEASLLNLVDSEIKISKTLDRFF